MIQIEKELSTAKKASIKSAELLTGKKTSINNLISNEGRDVKLQADIESEKIIKNYLKEKRVKFEEAVGSITAIVDNWK